MTLEYFLGDHLGSTSITTGANGAKVSEMRYKPWGEVRYSWTAGQSTTPAYKLPNHTFTGQYSHMDDPSTAWVMEGFGLMFYVSRLYDPALGRFIQADSIVPGGVQGLDRYAYVNNMPTRFTDPSGHEICMDDGYCGSMNSVSYWNKIIKEIERDYEISFEGNWSLDNKIAVITGVILAGSGIAKDIGTDSGSEAFKKAFIPTKFKWVDGACGGEDDRCYADAYSFPNTITFYSSHWTRQLDEKGLEIGKPFKKGNPAVSFALVIHELGHAFNTETGGAFNDATAAEGITNKEGFGIIKGASGQTEVTADLFANYILGTLGPRSDGINLPEFMQTNIATWVDLASNYVWSGNR